MCIDGVDFPVTAGDNKSEGEQSGGVKECEAEMVRDKEAAGIQKSIAHGCGMKGRLLPMCD